MNFLKRAIKSFYLSIKRKHGISRLKNATKNSVLKIVIGSSDIYQAGWIPTEMDYLNMLKENDWNSFFSDKQIDAIIAEHVWEHLTPEEGLLAAKNCYKFLKKGGYLRIAVPDGLQPDPNYIMMVKPGGTGNGADDHKILYNYQSISQMLEQAGFSVNCLEFFDENGKFIENSWKPEDGLVRRSKNHDPRNADGILKYTSLIVDAVKL